MTTASSPSSYRVGRVHGPELPVRHRWGVLDDTRAAGEQVLWTGSTERAAHAAARRLAAAHTPRTGPGLTEAVPSAAGSVPPDAGKHPSRGPVEPGSRPSARAPEPAAEMLAAALAYAARGWHVIPLRAGEKRPAFPDHTAAGCTGRDPRCARAGAHVGWQDRATTDPDRITRAWTAPPGGWGPGGPFGVGIACGPSGLVVVDLDVPKLRPGPLPSELPEPGAEPGVRDGADALAQLAARAGQPVPWDTYTVTTPSGGTHLYFTTPTRAGRAEGRQLSNTAGQVAPMVDSRAWGGQVVAPPTPGYRVINPTAPAALPDWLAELLTAAPLPAQQAVRVDLTGPGEARRRAYLDRAVSDQLAAVTTAPPGARNRALYVSAVALGQLVAGGELDASTIAQWLTGAALGAGLGRAETARTITSGLTAATHRPRTLTPTTETTGARR